MHPFYCYILTTTNNRLKDRLKEETLEYRELPPLHIKE